MGIREAGILICEGLRYPRYADKCYIDDFVGYMPTFFYCEYTKAPPVTVCKIGRL